MNNKAALATAGTVFLIIVVVILFVMFPTVMIMLCMILSVIFFGTACIVSIYGAWEDSMNGKRVRKLQDAKKKQRTL